LESKESIANGLIPDHDARVTRTGTVPSDKGERIAFGKVEGIDASCCGITCVSSRPKSFGVHIVEDSQGVHVKSRAVEIRMPLYSSSLDDM